MGGSSDGEGSKPAGSPKHREQKTLLGLGRCATNKEGDLEVKKRFPGVCCWSNQLIMSAGRTQRSQASAFANGQNLDQITRGTPELLVSEHREFQRPSLGLSVNSHEEPGPEALSARRYKGDTGRWLPAHTGPCPLLAFTLC